MPFDITGYLTEIDTGKIDADYMNSRFDKFLKELDKDQDKASVEITLNELHKTFSSLTQSEQKYAKLFLNDLQRGDAQLIDGHSFRDYINDYKDSAENAQLNAVVNALGLDKTLLVELMRSNFSEKNINRYGRFDALKASVNIEKAQEYFEKLEKNKLPTFQVNLKISKMLKSFILSGGIDH